MKILVEAGHGKNYRQKGEYDFGLFADDGSHEAAIAGMYSTRLQAVLKQHGQRPEGVREGSVANRLLWAFKRGKEMIISLHMHYDPGTLPGGRVLWATHGSKDVAEGVAQALGYPAVQADQETGLLRFNPSIQIELGNIASWQDMKRMRCSAYCSELCHKIARAISDLVGKED